MQNQAFSLNGENWAHIGRHALYVGLGAICAYLLNSVIPSIHVSGAAAFVVPIVTTIIVALQSFFSGN